MNYRITIKEPGRRAIHDEVRVPLDFDRDKGADDTAREIATRKVYGRTAIWHGTGRARDEGNAWKPVPKSIGGGLELVAAGLTMKAVPT